jgi:hypothetical protein
LLIELRDLRFSQLLKKFCFSHRICFPIELHAILRGNYRADT